MLYKKRVSSNRIIQHTLVFLFSRSMPILGIRKVFVTASGRQRILLVLNKVKTSMCILTEKLKVPID